MSISVIEHTATHRTYINMKLLATRLGLSLSRSRSRDNTIDNNDGIIHYLYTGQPSNEIPKDITHLRVDPSVSIIAEHAFYDCSMLEEVELYQSLVEIQDRAFRNCKSLKYITVPR